MASLCTRISSKCARWDARSLAANREGVTATEFAIIAPVFLSLLVGTFDLGQMAYGISVLNGAVQKAARDSALETANTSDADAMVRRMITPVFPNARVSSTRTSYYDFVDIGRPERWNDANNNGDCDLNESYVDENDNGQWDRDIGTDGNGGANDVVVYRVSVSYNPIFKIPFMPEQWNNRTLTSTAIKKNQPFATQQEYGTRSGVCS